MIQIIDLKFLDLEKVIACFLLETKEGLVLFETGPHSTFSKLKKVLNAGGLSIKDIKKVFLTHIHLDHSGAAWALAEEGADIYVHPIGKPHLENPEKLISSAQLIYREEMDRLWSDIKPIPTAQIIPVNDQEKVKLDDHLELTAYHTPGHASHHIAWKLDDLRKNRAGIVFAGDVAGMKIDHGPVGVPLPPPEVHFPDWYRSLQLLKSMDLEKIYLTHFGVISKNEINHHLETVQATLKQHLLWFEKNLPTSQSITQDYESYIDQILTETGLNQQEKDRYHSINPPFMSVLGVKRYLKKFHSPK